MTSFPVVWCGCGSVETKLCCTPVFCRLCTRIDNDFSTSLRRPVTRCLKMIFSVFNSEHTGEKINHINAFHWRHCPKNCTVETLWLSGLYPQSKRASVEHDLHRCFCQDSTQSHTDSVKAAGDTPLMKHTLHHITVQLEKTVEREWKYLMKHWFITHSTTVPANTTVFENKNIISECSDHPDFYVLKMFFSWLCKYHYFIILQTL